MLNNIKKAWILFNTIVIVLGFLTIAFWCCIDGEYINKPIEFETNILQTTKQVYKIGETVSVEWNFCKNTDEPAKLVGNLLNGYTDYFPAKIGVRRKGCYDGIDSIGYIPVDIPDEHLGDEFHIELIGTYKINPIKTKSYRFITNKFLIK